MKLGRVLKEARLALGKSLRDVEGGTGISNGYLSQLESGMVKQPSPNHLHKLADYYGLDYGNLMHLAGYVPTRDVAATNAQQTSSALTGLEELTEEDKQKIQTYIQDLRDARRIREISNSERVRPPRKVSNS